MRTKGKEDMRNEKARNGRKWCKRWREDTGSYDREEGWRKAKEKCERSDIERGEIARGSYERKEG